MSLLFHFIKTVCCTTCLSAQGNVSPLCFLFYVPGCTIMENERNSGSCPAFSFSIATKYSNSKRPPASLPPCAPILHGCLAEQAALTEPVARLAFRVIVHLGTVNNCYNGHLDSWKKKIITQTCHSEAMQQDAECPLWSLS